MKIKITTATFLVAIFFAFANLVSAQSAPADPKETTFMFYDEITQATVVQMTTKLEDWSENNPGQPLRIMLNSPGGDVFASFALMDELTHLRHDGHQLTIAVYGMAASAAGWIVQAGDKRIIGANSSILIHEISSGSEGKLSKMKEDIERTDRLQEQFIQLLASRSKLTARIIHSHIDGGHDWWISAQEAKRLGLVDEIEGAPFAPAHK